MELPLNFRKFWSKLIRKLSEIWAHFRMLFEYFSRHFLGLALVGLSLGIILAISKIYRPFYIFFSITVKKSLVCEFINISFFRISISVRWVMASRVTQLDTLGVMPGLTPKLFKSNTNKKYKGVTILRIWFKLAQRVVLW